MRKIVFIGFLLVLCLNVQAQEKELVNYSGREITLERVQNLPKHESPACFFIQTLYEYQKIFCMGRKSEVFFNREFVLGVKVSYWDSIFKYESVIDKEKNIIFVFVYYYTPSIIFYNQRISYDISFQSNYPINESPPVINLVWLAIPKPFGNYGVIVHFIKDDVNVEIITKIVKEK